MGTVTLPQHGAFAWNFLESKSGELVGLCWGEDDTVLLEPRYSSITVDEIYDHDWHKIIDTFYRVQADGKYGLILVEFYRLLQRTSATLVLQPVFDDFVQLDRFCFRTRVGQRYGLCCGGDEAVPPSYRGIELLALNNDAFVIKADMNYGVLARGDWAIPFAENKQGILNYLEQHGQTDLRDHAIFTDGPARVPVEHAPEPLMADRPAPQPPVETPPPKPAPKPPNRTAEVLLELLQRIPDPDTVETLLEAPNLLRLLLRHGWAPEDVKQSLAEGRMPGELLLDVLGREPDAQKLLSTLMKPEDHHVEDIQEGTSSCAVEREPHGLEGPMPAGTPKSMPYHEGDREEAHKRRAGEIVSSEPSNETLLTLISWLDMAYCAASVHGELDAKSSVLCQVLARAVIAVGYLINKTKPFSTIENTIHAAEVYALDPTEDHYDAFLEAATNSYPFGPGDGCFAVAETGYAGCEPGSGCPSGAGSLYQSGLESTAVMVVITKELLPWLNGEGDIVAKRKEDYRT